MYLESLSRNQYIRAAKLACASTARRRCRLILNLFVHARSTPPYSAGPACWTIESLQRNHGNNQGAGNFWTFGVAPRCVHDCTLGLVSQVSSVGSRRGTDHACICVLHPDHGWPSQPDRPSAHAVWSRKRCIWSHVHVYVRSTNDYTLWYIFCSSTYG